MNERNHDVLHILKQSHEGTATVCVCVRWAKMLSPVLMNERNHDGWPKWQFHAGSTGPSKSWPALSPPIFSRTLDTLQSIDSQKN